MIVWQALKWGVIITLLIVVLMWLAGLAAPAMAHSWYSPYCCSEKDCQSIVGAGYQADGSLDLEIVPGKHISVPPGFPVLPSRDGNYHVCIMINQIRCVYVPANS